MLVVVMWVARCEQHSCVFAGGGSRGRGTPFAVQLHLLVLPSHAWTTRELSELRAEHQTDWQLCLGEKTHAHNAARRFRAVILGC